MKIQVLITAVAMALAGTAFAAESTTTTTTTHHSSVTKSVNTGKHKVSRKAHHAKRRVAHAARHARADAHRMGAKGHHMTMTRQEMHTHRETSSSTDVNTQDRQGRMDDAYAKWRKDHS